ncbi:MAG: metallopeptidase family protein [Verrucomicrobia bacterium]|nr:metallopeptidase family protein [Verrucomicrobiota bacterium]
MDPREFAELVEEAVLGLPEEFARKLDNVEIVVEERPDAETIRKMKLERGHVLLGLYHGVPRTVRHETAPPLYPDRITIYRRSILATCRTPDEIRQQVRDTVIHEIGHHFGLSDDEMEDE